MDFGKERLEMWLDMLNKAKEELDQYQIDLVRHESAGLPSRFVAIDDQARTFDYTLFAYRLENELKTAIAAARDPFQTDQAKPFNLFSGYVDVTNYEWKKALVAAFGAEVLARMEAINAWEETAINLEDLGLFPNVLFLKEEMRLAGITTSETIRYSSNFNELIFKMEGSFTEEFLAQYLKDESSD